MLACDLPLASLTAPLAEPASGVAGSSGEPGTPSRAVTVHAPGRLHLGFMDPAGTLGRRFGSLGLVIEDFETVIELSAARRGAQDDEVSALTLEAAGEIGRVQAHLQQLRAATGCHGALQLRLVQVLPAHAGFGSGTQLALAVGRAFALCHGLNVGSATLARWLGRGLRSGIGIAGFDQGGLLLDGGPSADGTAAPVLSRLSLPEDWRVLVVQDSGARGLSGEQERQAIARLSPLPAAQAAEICHQVLMQVLPGAASADFATFVRGLARVQAILGAHFAPAQNGSAYTSAAVGQLLQWLAEAAPADTLPSTAVGQSSWGPTGFAFMPSLAAAEAAVRNVRAAGLVGSGIDLRIVRPRNSGALLICT